MQQFYQFGDSNLLDLQNTINLRHVGKDYSSRFFKNPFVPFSFKVFKAFHDQQYVQYGYQKR